MSQAEDLIKKYTNTILNLVIIIVALVFANNIYKKQTASIVALNVRKDSELAKGKVLENIGGLEQHYSLIKDAVNRKDTSLSIDKLGNIAKANDIKIISVRPDKEQDYPFYTKYPFSFTAVADDYHAIGKFVSALESSPDIYIVESISIKPVITRQISYPDKLNIDLRIATVLLKS